VHGDGEHLETGDGRVYYEVEGDAGSFVVIAGGGPGVGHSHYHPWFSALAARHRVVYFDYLGTGRSDRLTDPAGYSIELYARGLEALRAAVGADRWSVIGISFGGMPALAHALERPERVARLVLSNAQLDARTWQEGNVDAVNAALRSQFPERWEEILALRARGIRSADDAYGALYDELLADLEWVDPSGRPRLDHDEHNAMNLDVYTAIVGEDPEWEVTGTMTAFDPAPRLGEIGCPVLLVTGRWDRLTTPALTRRIRDAFPDAAARTEVLERSAHRPWAEEPERYFELVGGFLAA
jgi:proline iminopeptidase